MDYVDAPRTCVAPDAVGVRRGGGAASTSPSLPPIASTKVRNVDKYTSARSPSRRGLRSFLLQRGRRAIDLRKAFGRPAIGPANRRYSGSPILGMRSGRCSPARMALCSASKSAPDRCASKTLAGSKKAPIGFAAKSAEFSIHSRECFQSPKQSHCSST
jgi:hypothetical protein